MRFFVLEGLDGSGKTTQAKLLGEWFDAKSLPYVVTRQPSDNQVGKLARAATQGAFSLENETLALLFAADRFQHYHEEIAPALSRGNFVVCDRYYFSNLAYQGEDHAAMARIIAYNQSIMTPPSRKPDAVIFLDIPPEECLRRITETREEISIYETMDRLKLQRERFFTAFELLRDSENIIMVKPEIFDASHVFETIVNKISPLCSI
ncbi:MAG: dTMP kinase [Defluviitaleaceae bacterium]|nr:dTMP kinase [Defluviitaleaceae bacterium]